MLDNATLHRITRRGVREIIVEGEFVQLLKQGKPLRLKMGFDPSRPDIHLGHVVGLRKLKQLQDLGHQVILIVGDWTAQIGDPSGQSVTRPMLTQEEVKANAESYMRQFFKIIDRQRTQVVWQSEWFGKFSLADVIRLTSRFTVAQFLDRDDFASRFRSGRPIAITELLYPLLQAYDSVAIEADVEFGGTDQKFNLLVGRDLQGMMGQRPQQCFLMPILVGTDGVRKMSKSLDNYIAVDDPPNDMYGEVMSLPDNLMMDYFQWLTDVPDGELETMAHDLEMGGVNPMELKKRLAWEITSQFYDEASAATAQARFEQVVQRREVPPDIREFEIRRTELTMLAQDRNVDERLKNFSINSINGEIQSDYPEYGAKKGDLVVNLAWLLQKVGLTPSVSEARRKVNEHAVDVLTDGKSPLTQELDKVIWPIRNGTVLKLGRNYVRVKIS